MIPHDLIDRIHRQILSDFDDMGILLNPLNPKYNIHGMNLVISTIMHSYTHLRIRFTTIEILPTINTVY